MDVIGAMKARRSVRSYLPRKVEQEKLNAVLEAVRLPDITIRISG